MKITYNNLLPYIKKGLVGYIDKDYHSIDILNEYSTRIRNIIAKHTDDLVILKKWKNGYSWNRWYDENWDDHTDEYYIEPDEEPEFESLITFLSEYNLKYHEVKDKLVNLIYTNTYCDDPYYGGAEYNLRYIFIKDLNNFINTL